MTQQFPIESQFEKHLVDNLNAEISLGTVANMQEAVKWLSYTYLFVRMRKNPLVYGMNWNATHDDPNLGQRRHEILQIAAKKLHKSQMIIYDERTGLLVSKDLGRIASNYYILHNSVEIFNQQMTPNMTEADALSLVSMCSEFSNVVFRPDELMELKKLKSEAVCDIKGQIDSNAVKTNILLQAYISKVYLDNFALVSDCGYVAKNAARILRALFEISMSRNWVLTSDNN